MNFKEKLRQLEGATEARRSDRVQNHDFEHLAEYLGGEILQRRDEAFIIVRSEKPLTEKHGQINLNIGSRISGETISTASKKTVNKDFDLTRAVFLDTETTGLAGGTGTYVFQLGVGYIRNQIFHVDQFVLPRLSDESWMLEYLNQYFENRTGIISFNGKSFDVPLLQTRFIQNRTHSSLDMQQHFDLLHAARRIWKDDFGDCRLGTLESRVLGFRRVGDIPGEQIPQIYMDYLRFGEYQPLKPVIEHNRLDIVSLLALVIKISELIHDSDKLAFQQKQRVAQLFSATKKHQDASNIYRQARNEKAPSPYAQAEYLWEYGQSLKRAKDFVAAEKVWLEMVDLPHRSVEAMIELAKHFEHRLKDFKQALAFTERAIHKIQIRTELAIRTAKDEMLLAELNHRKTRVEEKLNKL